MGKCSICGKKIEYNNYKMVNGDVYCPDCVPKTSFEKAVEKVDTEELANAIVETIEAAKEAAPKDCMEQTEEEALAKMAEIEAQEQFEKEMAGHGDLAETDRNEPEPEEKPKRKRGKRKQE